MNAMKARLYKQEDEAELVKLAAETMPGWVRLRYDYAAGYAAAEALKGKSEIVVVEDGEGRVAGCGTRSTRWLYLDGAPRRVGYLSGLRSFAGARGGFGVFRGFAKIRELERAKPNELTFMTVLDGNSAGRALLTSGRVGLPECRPRGRVVTYALGALCGAAPQGAAFDELREFYSREAPRKQLFPVFGRNLPPGLSVDDFFAVRREGHIAAAGAVWNHGARRRIFVDGYMFGLRVMRPVFNALFALSRCPRLPAPGSEFACSYLAYALAENDDPVLFAELLEAARRKCAGRALVLSLHSEDPMRRTVEALGGWRYGSEFLTVGFDGRTRDLRGVPHVEAGAL